MLSLSLLLACTGADPAAPAPPEAPPAPKAPLTLRFSPAEVPTTTQESPGHSATVTVRGETFPLRYQPLLHEGQVLGERAWGSLLDVNGAPLMKDGAPEHCNGSDFSGLMQVDGQGILISHMECQPGAVWLAGLSQDEAGTLSPEWIRPVDAAGVRGGNLHCAGHLTPWGTHLASEEYETDARQVGPDGRVADNMYDWNEMHRYFPGGQAYVYDYGWMPELRITDAQGTHSLVKRYALGRFSHEQGWVMPDERAVYLTDDGTNTGFYLFVADRPGDLSAGHLYAARFTQESEQAFGLSWVPLGHATEAEINATLAKGSLRFADLFEAAEPVDGACPEAFTSINTSWGHECLQLRPGMEVLASRLETRRYAAMQGATTELSKEEGVGFDPETGRLYLVLSQLTRGMLRADPRWDVGGADHIGVTENRCGAILGMGLGAGVQDAAGAPIDSPYVASRAEVVLAGAPGEEDSCALDGISNPDNIAVLPGANLVMIAEDTSRHPVDLLWAYHLDTGELVPVMSAPGEAEVTGIQWTPDLGGHGYLTLTFQQHYRSESPSSVGVLGPFPVLKP
ncbi:MAG: DUF839 domain-containing protein [Alphaproteobacteria bacterium]|nr:DUF839 domain-containing protein [Alphaproteobacteria bacterium]